jgi:iron complex transport system permease protein
MSRALRNKGILLFLLVLSLATLLTAPFIGEHYIGLDAFLRPDESGYSGIIYWDIRFPRCVMAFLAGAGLAVAGMVFQSLFQNALASPFTLGVAGGASFAAALHVYLGFTFHLCGIPGTSFSAFIGALAAMLLVLALSRKVQGDGPAHVLLAGIAVNFSFTGAISFVLYLSNYVGSFRIIRWLMGGVEVAGFDTIFQLVPLVISGTLAILYFTKELNLITTGEEMAKSRGVNVKTVKRTLFITTSLMVGGVVSFCGPIGFIGMMAPHIARRLVGGDHRHLIPASLLFGGLFLTITDTVSRVVIAPAELPVGVMTSLCGGPFFLWLLIRYKSSKSESWG